MPVDPSRDHLPSSSASFEALSIGTWNYDVVQDRLRCDAATSAMYGVDERDGQRGLPIEHFTAAIHPEDRATGRAKRRRLIDRGGLFVVEYRVLLPGNVTRWLLVRGRYEPDATGRVTRGRGIVIDVTESKLDGFTEGHAFFMISADDQEAADSLDRAAKHALDAHRAIIDLGILAPPLLRAAAETLLLEIGRNIAAAIVAPAETSKRSH